VYTLALLRCHEQELEIPSAMFTQGFMTRCLGSVRGPDSSTTYGPSEVCTRYLMGARAHVPTMNTYDFSHYNQLVNQLGRRMHTVFMTSLCTHMHSRRSRAIRTSIGSMFPTISKGIASFVTKHVLWATSGAPSTSFRRPVPSRYKDPQVRSTSLLEDPGVIGLIRLHTNHLPPHQGTIVDPDDGCFS
jgi:hypothetical protein